VALLSRPTVPSSLRDLPRSTPVCTDATRGAEHVRDTAHPLGDRDAHDDRTRCQTDPAERATRPDTRRVCRTGARRDAHHRQRPRADAALPRDGGGGTAFDADGYAVEREEASRFVAEFPKVGPESGPEQVRLADLDGEPHAAAFPGREPKTVRLSLDAGQSVPEHTHPDRTVLFHALTGAFEVRLDGEMHAVEAGRLSGSTARRRSSRPRPRTPPRSWCWR